MLDIIRTAGQKIFAPLFTGRATSVGARFSHLCVVGLNRAEFLGAGADNVVSGETWQDITDEQTRRRMAMIFFAPRELDGQPVPPAELLAEDMEDTESIALMEQSLGNMPLLDLCRMPPALPGQVNMVVAADIIFHWDNQDNYIVPTDKLMWVKDIQRILKYYPKNSDVTVYTMWEPEKVGDLGVPIKPLRALPLHNEVWVNIPTVQEKLGTHVLVFAIFLAIMSWVGLHLQGSKMVHLDEQIRITEQKIPREAGFRSLSRFMREQQEFMKYKTTLPFVVQDIAQTMQEVDMNAASLEIENPNPLEPTHVFITRIEAQKGAYQGWLQEEPVAKNLLAASSSISAIRKPPGNTFKLEGLLPMREIHKQVTQAIADQKTEEVIDLTSGDTSS